MRTHTLHVRRYVAGSEDAHGNATGTHGTTVEWLVWGLAPGAMAEPNLANRDTSEVVWSVLAPADDSIPSGRDLVVVDGEDFEVLGDPKDYTRGPWESAHFAGVVVELKRTEG